MEGKQKTDKKSEERRELIGIYNNLTPSLQNQLLLRENH
jgi:hypothetical protein